jgi:hypothetical protein
MLAQLVIKLKRAELATSRASSRATSILPSPSYSRLDSWCGVVADVERDLAAGVHGHLAEQRRRRGGAPPHELPCVAGVDERFQPAVAAESVESLAETNRQAAAICICLLCAAPSTGLAIL